MSLLPLETFAQPILCGRSPYDKRPRRHCGESPYDKGPRRHCGESPYEKGPHRHCGESPYEKGPHRHYGESPYEKGPRRHYGESLNPERSGTGHGPRTITGVAWKPEVFRPGYRLSPVCRKNMAQGWAWGSISLTPAHSLKSEGVLPADAVQGRGSCDGLDLLRGLVMPGRSRPFPAQVVPYVHRQLAQPIGLQLDAVPVLDSR